MKKILSKEAIKKKNQRNQIFIGVILILIMASGTLGYAFFNRNATSSNTGSEVKYNGVKFQLNGGMWYTTIEKNSFATTYNPFETENITANVDFDLDKIYGKPLYYVSDNDNAIGEIIYNLGRYIERYQEVCLEGEECNNNFAFKNCSSNVIVFREANNTNIYEDENCLFIEAPYDAQVLAGDRIIFKALGIQ